MRKPRDIDLNYCKGCLADELSLGSSYKIASSIPGGSRLEQASLSPIPLQVGAKLSQPMNLARALSPAINFVSSLVFPPSWRSSAPPSVRILSFSNRATFKPYLLVDIMNPDPCYVVRHLLLLSLHCTLFRYTVRSFARLSLPLLVQHGAPTPARSCFNPINRFQCSCCSSLTDQSSSSPREVYH